MSLETRVKCLACGWEGLDSEMEPNQEGYYTICPLCGIPDDWEIIDGYS